MKINNNISKLAIGSVQFGLAYGISNKEGVTSSEEVTNILEFAKSQGIQTIDTAVLYGNSEEALGRNDLKDFKVVSKFPNYDTNEVHVNDFVSKSLEKLNVPNLYAYLAHDADSIINSPDIWEQLLLSKNQGKIKKIGVSLYTPEQFEKLLELNIIPDIVQIPFNILDRRFQSKFKTMNDMNIEVHVRSAFLQGLFHMDYEDVQSHFETIKPLLKVFKQEFSKQELINYLLNFIMDFPEINQLVLGVNEVTQLKENIDSLNEEYRKEFDLNSVIRLTDISDEIILPTMWPKK